MKRPSPNALLTWLAIMVLTLVVAPPHVRRAWAAFNASPQSWTAAYELDPLATDPVSQGDDHIRQAKTETRDRAETEHDWGVFGIVTADTGRHLPGSAMAFLQNAAPTVNGTITAACLFEADRNGNTGCEGGRIWFDLDGPDNVGGTADDATLSVSVDSDLDGDADVWGLVANPASLVPQNALILWDTSNACPNGYVEATEYRNLSVRGADRAAADAGIPDNAGVSCSGAAAPAGCGAPAGVTNYDDLSQTAELAAHSHTFTGGQGGTTLGSGPFIQGATGAPNYNLASGTTDTTGAAQESPGPIRTVLFCRKS